MERNRKIVLIGGDHLPDKVIAVLKNNAENAGFDFYILCDAFAKAAQRQTLEFEKLSEVLKTANSIVKSFKVSSFSEENPGSKFIQKPKHNYSRR